MSGDLIVDKSMWLLGMYLLELLNEILGLLDQLALGHLRQLLVELVVELLQLFNFIFHALPLAQQCEQLVFQLGIELSLDVLYKVLDLFAFVFFSSGYLFNRYLDILLVLGQLSQPLLEANCFFLDNITMLIVYLCQPQELVVLVLVSTEQAAFTANGHFARLAIVVKLRSMLGTDLCAILQQSSISQVASIRIGLVKRINCSRDLFNKPAINELMHL